MKKTGNTKAQKITDIIATLKGEELQFNSSLEEMVELLEKELESLSKRAEKKNTNEEQYEKDSQLIIAYLATVEHANGMEICNACKLKSSQYVATLFNNRLIPAGLGKKESVGGRKVYSLV